MFGESILEEIENVFFSKIKNDLQKMYAIWNELGISIDEKSERSKQVWRLLKSLLKDMYAQENTFCIEIKGRIAEYKLKIEELANILAMPVKDFHEGSLIEIVQLLEEELETLSKLKQERLVTYQDLKSEGLKYSQLLNLDDCFDFKTGIPSNNDILELENHIKMLKKEKQYRQDKFLAMKNELISIYEDTELTPESPLEFEILSSKDGFPPGLGMQTLKDFEEVIINTRNRKQELENKKIYLVDRLIILWQRLKEEESTQKEFLSRYSDYRLSTLWAIEQEIERCDNIKKENIGSFVSELRMELLQLWKSCHASQLEKDSFEYFTTNDMSEEVLEVHEIEVDKWNKYYGNVKHILKKVEKRQELWEMLVALEIKATDPNRFKNRKGNLLKDEKQRKKLQKDLPAIETEIFDEIASLEAQDGIIFLYNGMDFRTFVSYQWNEKNKQKENKKIEKAQNNLLQPNNEANLKTPIKKTLKSIPKTTPGKLVKPLLGTSIANTPVSSRRKIVSNTDKKSKENKVAK